MLSFGASAPVFWMLFLLVVGPVGAAGENNIPSQKQLDIRIQANAFGKANSAEITAVLNSAASEIWRYCPGTQIAGIDVYYRPDHPQTDFKRKASGRIAIGLSAHDTHWAQYSFQFAHEFCHALVNFSNNPKQLVRFPRHANLWLEESFCETASLFSLRAMGRSWQVDPPYAAWRAYAPWLNDYAAKRLALTEDRLPHGISFLVWFHRNEAALRQNSDLRDRNTVIAIELLPIFEAHPRGWEAMTYLDHGSHVPEESLAQRLAEWRSQCPKDLRPFVARIATVFAVKLQSSSANSEAAGPSGAGRPSCPPSRRTPTGLR